MRISQVAHMQYDYNTTAVIRFGTFWLFLFPVSSYFFCRDWIGSCQFGAKRAITRDLLYYFIQDVLYSVFARVVILACNDGYAIHTI